MIDHHGEDWETVRDAAAQVRVRPRTIYQWARRGKVRSHHIGATMYVSMVDIRHAEHDWRTRIATTR